MTKIVGFVLKGWEQDLRNMAQPYVEALQNKDMTQEICRGYKDGDWNEHTMTRSLHFYFVSYYQKEIDKGNMLKEFEPFARSWVIHHTKVYAQNILSNWAVTEAVARNKAEAAAKENK